MTLDADEFIRRFQLHVLPDGFHRIRHYGYLANGVRVAKLAYCRLLLAASEPAPPATRREVSETTRSTAKRLGWVRSYSAHLTVASISASIVPHSGRNSASRRFIGPKCFRSTRRSTMAYSVANPGHSFVIF